MSVEETAELLGESGDLVTPGKEISLPEAESQKKPIGDVAQTKTTTPTVTVYTATGTSAAVPAGIPVGTTAEGLNRVYDVVGESFPDIVLETIACLSVAATLLLDDQQNPVGLNLEGPPSSTKTTIIEFLEGAGTDKVYKSDKFTPKSFVSHSASVSREKLQDVDLLPRIRHKVFLVPELAPLFGLRNEDLLENFSILTRVFDGHGLSTDSGVHGQRGHTGDFLFAWIGCTTPIDHRVWKTMGKLGSRFLFIEMPATALTDAELVHDIAGGSSYKDRVARCQEAVTGFLAALWAETGGIRAVEWDRPADPTPVMLRIAAYARVLARLRGTISVWREGSGDDESYNFTTPVIEQPHRAMSLLYALARGHAIVHGRRQLDASDLPLVARAALESTPTDRRAVMRILLRDEGVATTASVVEALGCSAPTARAILETLEKLGIGTYINPGAPMPATLTLAESLGWLLDAHAIEKKVTPRGKGIERKLTPSSASIEKKVTPCTELTVVGDPMYPVLIADAAKDGHITAAEFDQRRALHYLLEEPPNEGAA